MSGADVRPPIPASLARRPVKGGLAFEDAAAVLEFLAARSRAEGDCLVWALGCSPKGYGRARVEGRMMFVHRAAWIARHGTPPPDKPKVLHHCDNPPCWQDGHLFVGTDKDNAEDREAKGRNGYSKRTHCPQEHEYDEANTYVARNGKRCCRKCLRSRDGYYHEVHRNRLPGPEMLAVGSRIRDARLELGITQKALAQILGIGHSSLCDLEKGRRQVPPDKVEAFAATLSLNAIMLIPGDGHD